MVTVQINKETRMTADYDSVADVLYVMINRPESVEGDEQPEGIELDYSVKNGMPCGVTVIGYNLYGWAGKTDKLAKIVGDHLAIQPTLISSKITEATATQMH
jgi:uncharacterized protein YuzE